MSWSNRSIQDWDGLASLWDNNIELWTSGPRHEMLNFFFNFTGEGPLRVLDLGCGPGVSTLHMKNKGYTPVGVDQSPKMIEMAKQRGVEGIVNESTTLPFQNSTFDSIFACTSLEWTNEPHLLIKEMSRVLKPGGRLVAITMGPTARSRESGYDRLYGKEVIHNMMMPWELHRMLIEHNFTCSKMKGKFNEDIPSHVIDLLQKNWVYQASLSNMWGFGMIKPL